MSQSVRVLLALIAGLLSGFAVVQWLPWASEASGTAAGVVGTLWFNCIRMTIMPLVVSLLITGIASAGDTRTLGKMSARALMIFAGLLTFAGTMAATFAPILLRWCPAAGNLADLSVIPGADRFAKAPSWSQWLVSLVPTNPVQAASEGDLLPVIVFTTAFALSLLHIRRERREPIVAFFEGVSEAMFVILRWIIFVAPLGVFALSYNLAARLGISIAGALGYFVLVLSLILIGILIALYLITAWFSKIPVRRFAKALAPAQAFAFTSRSSMAALPVLMEAAESRLGYSRVVSGFALPFTVSVFRLSVPVSQVVSALFVARLYDVSLSLVQIATLVFMAVLLSFSVPGVPNASFVAMIPLFQAVGLPTEAIGILLAVDVIPDALKTVVNVTGHLTAVTLFTRPSPMEVVAAVSTR